MIVYKVEKMDLTKKEVESIEKVADNIEVDIINDMKVLSKNEITELI